MKKIAILLAVALVLLMSMTAVAEGSLNDKLQGLLGTTGASDAGSADAAAPAADAAAPAAPAASSAANVGVDVRIDDAFFEKVRSSAYNREDYSKHVNVFIELKNVSGKTLYISDATITAYDVNGNVLDQEEYAYTGPDMVANGASFFVWDWFYDPDCELSDIAYFEVELESETDSYREYALIDGVGLMGEGIAGAQITNSGSDAIYGIDATIVVSGSAGQILDVANVSTGNAVGIAPGSSMILRDNVEDHLTGDALTTGDVAVYAMYQLD